MLLHSDCVGGHLLRGRVVPFAVDFDDVPLLAGLIQRLVDAVVTVAVDGSAGDAAHFEDLAAIGQMLVEPLRPIDPEALLVDIDVDRVFAIENIVERHQNDACVIGSLDDGLERRRILSVDDDRVEAGIDEIIDCCDLRGDVLAGRDDLELLELGRNVGLRGEGLGGLDHLNAPGVGDEAVGERDAERPFLCGPLEELGLGRSTARNIAGQPMGRPRPRVRRRRRALRRRTRRSTWRRRRRRWRIGGNDSSLSSLLHLDRPASSKPRHRRAQIFLSVIATAAPESRPEGVSGALLALTCQYNRPPRVHKPVIDRRTTRRTASKEPARDGAGLCC